MFGTFLFFHILGIIIPTDFHIFQKGLKPPNSLYMFELFVCHIGYTWVTIAAHHSRVPFFADPSNTCMQTPRVCKKVGNLMHFYRLTYINTHTHIYIYIYNYIF